MSSIDAKEAEKQKKGVSERSDIDSVADRIRQTNLKRMGTKNSFPKDFVEFASKDSGFDGRDLSQTGVGVKAILDLLHRLEEKISNKQKEEIAAKLLLWAQKMGAGDPGIRQKEYSDFRKEVREYDRVREEFIGLLYSSSVEARGWTASFVGQLFDEKQALDVIMDALKGEANGEAASWMALSLGRLSPRNSSVCSVIADTYSRFEKKLDEAHKIARAWGIADCPDAAAVLVQLLQDSDMDHQNIVLNGLAGMRTIEDMALQPDVTQVMLDSESDNVRDQCIGIIQQFPTVSKATVSLLERSAKGNPAERRYKNAQRALEMIGRRSEDSESVDDKALPIDKDWIPHYDSDSVEADQLEDCNLVENEARAFAKIAASKDVHPPLAIGVFGEWGSGKTFFMEKIAHYVNVLSKIRNTEKIDSPFCSSIVQIRFNAWHYMESNLWASLVEYIFQELDLWLYQEEAEQSSINKLFDQLSITRQLKLESLQSVIESRRERLRADQRLESARNAYERAKTECSSFRSAPFWTAVIETFNSLLSDSEKDSLSEASSVLGIPKLSESTEQFFSALEEVGSQAGRAKMLYRATAAQLGRGGSFAFMIALIILLPLGLIVLRAFLSGLESLGWLGRINDLMLGFVGLVTAITAGIGKIASGASRALDTLEGLQGKWSEAISSKTSADEESFENKRRELAKIENELTQAEQSLAMADERVQEAVKEWTAATPRGRLNRFIREKITDGDYAKHLGIVAAIRKDFGQLSEIMSKTGTNKISQEMYEKAQAEYRAEVERLIAEAKVNGGSDDILSDEEIEGLQKTAKEKPADLPSFDRIILYIDDLDRCPPEKVVSVLQAIHLLLCFKLFVVVVAVDARWISRALIDEYPGLLEENVIWVEPQNAGSSNQNNIVFRKGASSHDYLEKIFQIPYWVRPMDSVACERYVDMLTKADLDSRDRSVKRTAPETQADDSRATEDDQDAADKVGQVDIHQRAKLASNSTAETDGGDIPATKDKGGGRQLDNTASVDVGDYLGMSLDDKEVELLKVMAPYAGASPRRGLRFVNVYRLIKSSLTKKQLKNFVGDDGQGLDYKSVITQLAISTGAPRTAQYFFRLVLDENTAISSIADLLLEIEKDPRLSSSPKQEKLQLTGAINKISELSPEESAIGGGKMIDALRKWASIARRYSFTARPI